MGGLNYVTTVLQYRCKGMTLMRLPLSVWGIFTATILALLAFPALLVSAIMMILDHSIGTSFFMPAMISAGEQLSYNDGSPILFQHLFWFLRTKKGVEKVSGYHRYNLIARQLKS